MNSETPALISTDPTTLATITSRARDYAEHSKAENTRRAYTADWTDFTSWCAGHHLPSLPASPETVAIYLADLAERGRKPATLSRRIVAISQAHKTAGYETPTSHAGVRAVLTGIKREVGTVQTAKSPAVTADIRRMVKRLPEDTLAGIRDRALLLMGFAGGFRRAELVALDAEDVEVTPDGLDVTLRRSKTDQEGQGRKVGIPGRAC